MPKKTKKTKNAKKAQKPKKELSPIERAINVIKGVVLTAAKNHDEKRVHDLQELITSLRENRGVVEGAEICLYEDRMPENNEIVVGLSAWKRSNGTVHNRPFLLQFAKNKAKGGGCFQVVAPTMGNIGLIKKYIRLPDEWTKVQNAG